MISNWQDDAACKGMDTEVFFKPYPQQILEAKAVCAGCPVVDRCLDWGLRYEYSGVWGGMSSNERRSERRHRRIPLHAPEVLRGS